MAVGGLTLIAAGKMLTFLCNGLFTKWTAETFSQKISTGEGLYISVLSAIGNFFGPLLGGASIRAVYLKKYHNLSYSNFTSTLMGYYIISFVASSLLALASLSILPKTRQSWTLIFVFILWLILLLSLLFIRLPKKERLTFFDKNKASRFILKVVYEVEEGWQVILKDRGLLLKLVTLATLSLFATLFVVTVEFTILGIGLNFAAVGLYSALVSLSLLVSITPGAIGIREAILILLSSTIGVTNNEIVQIAIIDRGVHFLLLAALFVLVRVPQIKRLLIGRKG